jgi:glycosyltransferase involved in cell wall biosynthesis
MKKKEPLNYIEISLLSKDEKILVAIPTRDRPEYLSILLSSLIHQTEQAFDVLIVDTGDEPLDILEAPVERFLSTLNALGHDCFYEHVKVAGRSEVAAVNFILTEAVFKGYEYLYKTDDDHLLQPDTLERLKKACNEQMQKHGAPVLVSAMTPYMKKTGSSYSGPEGLPYISWPESVPITQCCIEKGELVLEPGQFSRFMNDVGIRYSHLASAANFFMKPDARVLWEDIGHCSMHADAVWMIQIAKFFGYKFFFDTGCVSWHVTAPSGGVREEDDNYTKMSDWDARRREHLAYVMVKLATLDPEFIEKMSNLLEEKTGQQTKESK